MNEDELLEKWRNERPMYEAWGGYIVMRLEEALSELIQPHLVDVFLKIPPKPRVKSEQSFIEKALHRKSYVDPYSDVTDKVGVRFVVLLSSDISTIVRAIEASDTWDASKDRDYEDEQASAPMQFGYQSVHFVVRAKSNIDVEGQLVAAGTPCEIQVRTLLQHAHSELTHDTIYKSKVDTTWKTMRVVAKSMALIEATDDFFEKVVSDIKDVTKASEQTTHELSSVYRQAVGKEPQLTRIESLIVDAFKLESDENLRARVEKFLVEKSFVIPIIAQRWKNRLLFRQPSLLAVYLYASEKPSHTKNVWPLTEEELRPLFSDLGLNFDSY